MNPKRTERVEIKMELDKKAYARHSQAVAALIPGHQSQMNKDDLLKVDYSFVASYFGNVVKCLEAVKKICADPDVVVTASCPALEQGRLLVFEALKRLDSVIKTVKER